jgi:tetratricopeptide (TPR) repeat protein/RsiW-degrading membrane proteinase PrsW (M82 family)
MNSLAWLAWATAPASIALLAYLLWRGGLSGRLLLEALAIGATLGSAIGFAEAPFDLKANPLHFTPQTIAFLFAGLPEEGMKMLGVAAFLRAHWLARDRRDVVLAAGALSLGFSALENIFYLAGAQSGWATLALERALTATPFHVFEGLAGGFVVASVRPSAAGFALALAAWIGLAAVHGVYDFAVFAGAASAHPPLALQRFLAALGLDVATTMKAALAGAQAFAALLAGAALFRLRSAPTPIGQSRLARIARSRGAGWALGLLLGIGAGIALAGGALASLMLESGGPFLAAALLAVSPLALGALFIVFPARGRSKPMSPHWRWALAGAGAVAALALVGAALVWGPEQWRGLTALRFEARGAQFAARGEYPRAIEAYGRALAAAPGRIDALSRRAAAYAASGQYAPALADVDSALRVAPDVIGLYVQRAEIDRARNDPAASLADLALALQRKPSDPELLAMRGQSRLEAGDSAGAYADLSAASRQAPDNPVVRRSFAAWDVNAGDFDAAIRDLNARLHADPNDATAAFQRGRVWLYKGDGASAVVDLTRADRDPGVLYPAIWRFLARARLKQDGAAELAERLVAANEKWPAPVARMLLGRIDLAAAKAAASNDGDRCEADFYDAASKVGAAPTDEVSPLLQAVLKECPTGFIEYEGAKAELRRLGR